MEGMAFLACSGNELERAAVLLGAAAALRPPLSLVGLPLSLWVSVAEQEARERQITALRGALGEERFTAAWAQGQAMRDEQALAYALDER
jgi:hypothetical protein